MKTVLSLGAWVLSVLVFSGVARAEDWPKEFVIAEDTESPNKQYAVLVPSFEKGADGGDRTNYLVDQKAHRLLGKIRGAERVVGEPRGGLGAYWAADSSKVVLEYTWQREGFREVVLVEVRDGAIAQKDLGTLLHEKLDGEVARHRKGGKCAADLFCRWSPDGKLRVRALGDSQGKRETDAVYAALFQGTYDVTAHKWTVMDVRPVGDADEDGLSALYRNEDHANETYEKEEDKAKARDEEMNEVYQALRVILPAAKFAEVKKEQLAWLKKRDAAGTVKEKIELLEGRIRELRGLAW